MQVMKNYFEISVWKMLSRTGMKILSLRALRLELLGLYVGKTTKVKR